MAAFDVDHNSHLAIESPEHLIAPTEGVPSVASTLFRVCHRAAFASRLACLSGHMIEIFAAGATQMGRTLCGNRDSE